MNLNNSKILIIVLMSVTLFFTGCKTYEYFNIEILEPAELYFSPELQSVVIAHNISNNDADSLGMPFKIFDVLSYDSINIDTALANTAILNIKEMLGFTERFSVSVADSLERVLPKNTVDFTVEDVNFIRQLCKSDSADSFILLNTMLQSNNYDVFLSNTGEYFGEFEVIFKTDWLFINPFISKLIDKKVFLDTIYYQVEPLVIDDKNTGFEARKAALTLAAASSGRRYGARISPHFVETSRMIFKKGDKNIKTGFEQAQLGNWKNAAWFWKNALSSDEVKIKALACFNLALANEMEGLLEPALEWAKDSYRYFPDTLNATYISILEERISQQNELLIQMDRIDIGR